MSRIPPPQALTDSQEVDCDDVTRVASGDRQALGRLYDRHAGLLTALGLKMIPDPEIVGDILHDVFVEVWEKASSYDATRAKVRTWLGLRMRSRCLDKLRSAAYSRRSRVTDDGFERIVQADSESRANEVGDPVDKQRALIALDVLSPEQRSVIECVFFQGLTSSETANELNLSIGTVKSRVRLAMARLRNALGVNGDV